MKGLTADNPMELSQGHGSDAKRHARVKPHGNTSAEMSGVFSLRGVTTGHQEIRPRAICSSFKAIVALETVPLGDGSAGPFPGQAIVPLVGSPIDPAFRLKEKGGAAGSECASTWGAAHPPH